MKISDAQHFFTKNQPLRLIEPLRQSRLLLILSDVVGSIIDTLLPS